MAAVQQNSILCRFPTEILENIALEVVRFEPLGPPKALIPLLCTCKSVHNMLAFTQCYDLFARIFQTKFDIGAVRRRFGPKSVRSTNLAMQLKKYCTNLQEIRRGDIYSPDIHDILRTSFLMATENDGRNAHQLAWAGLDKFVDRFVRVRLCEDVSQHNGWPAESSVNALALWLMWFTTTQESLEAESMEQRQQIIDMVLPYVVLPFRYPSAYAPPNHLDLPLAKQFGQRFPHSIITAHGHYPLYRPPHILIEDIQHFGHFREFSRPLITIAAKLLYFARREMVPIGIPTHLPIDRAHALSLGHTHVRPTQADVHEVNSHQSVKLVQRAAWDYYAEMDEDQRKSMDGGLWTPTLGSASAKWDNDWNRATFCFDPWQKMPLKGVTYTHGMLNGLWQGRMLVPHEGSYMGLMGMAQRPPTFGEGNPQIATVPLFMRLREHHCINPQFPILTGGRRNGFDDGLENAWLPPVRMRESNRKVTVEDEHGNISVYDTYVPGQPNAHDEETCTACIHEKLNAENDMRRRSASLSDSESESESESETEFASQAQAQQQSLAIPPMDAEVEDIFTNVGLGADENMDDDMDGYSESGEDSDTEEVLHRSCSGIQDLLLTGETDLSHGQAWNHYIFYGRVRRWDGLIALVRVPRHGNGRESVHLGRWVFTGYVVGAQNFVGTWRALRGQDVGVPTWESAFTVSRRDD